MVRDFESIDVPEPYDPDGAAIEGTPIEHVGTDVSGLTREERRIIRRYTAAMIYQIDMAVGRIVEGLKQAGQWDNTIIVFTSDHGDWLCDHARLRKEQTASDMLLHVPFILRAPGSDLPARVDTPMSNTDVLPTLTALAGIAAPDWCHGANIAQVVRENRDHPGAWPYCANGASK